MPDDYAFFRKILGSKQHRPGGRAIIFDSSRRHLLVEKNLGAREEYVAFPGGGIELGETLQECITRELDEEIGAKIVDFNFLFLVENFIPFEGEYLHGIELYCEVKLGSDQVESQLEGYEFPWIDVSKLGKVDLRPHIVRDRIVDGSYKEIRHLISRT
jgi:8-oxo-dGTP pyrophosphatase MutT (NUDIX family)